MISAPAPGSGESPVGTSHADGGSAEAIASDVRRIYYCQLAQVVTPDDLARIEGKLPDALHEWMRMVEPQSSTSIAWANALRAGAAPYKTVSHDTVAAQKITDVTRELAAAASNPSETELIPVAAVGVFLAAVALGYTIAHSWGK